MTNSENEVFPGTANVRARCKINGGVCYIPFSNQSGRDLCTRRFFILKIYKNKTICALG